MVRQLGLGAPVSSAPISGHREADRALSTGGRRRGSATNRLAPGRQELADRGEVVLEGLREIGAGEGLGRVDQLAQVAAGWMCVEQRAGPAVVYPRLGQRGVVGPLAQLQIGDQLVDDLGLFGELLLAAALA